MIKCIGCLIYDRSKKMFLLQQRSRTSTHPLKLGLWGGKMKAVESFPKALSRELEEELGSVPHYEKLYPLDTYLSEDNEFIYYSFLMIVNEFDSIEVKANETFDYVWMPSHLIERLNLHPGFRLTFEDKRDCIQRIINKNQNRS